MAKRSEHRATPNSASKDLSPISRWVIHALWVTLGASVGLILVLGGWIWRGLEARVTRFEDSVSKVQTDVARLHGDVEGIRREISHLGQDLPALIRGYSRAMALGFRQPSVELARLGTPTRASVAETVPGGVEYDLRLTLLEVTKDRAVFLVNGKIPGVEFRDVKIGVRLDPGKPTELRLVTGPSGLPRIYIAVVERVDPQTAVVAIRPIDEGRRRL